LQDSANSRKEELVMKMFKTIAFLGILIIGMGGSAQAATYDYTLEIELLAGYSALPDAEKIASLAFDLASGDAPITNFSLGGAVPTGWIFANDSHPFYAMYDEAGATNPIISGGLIISIFSDTPLNFSLLEFYDSDGVALTSEFVSTSGFQAVPIPAAAWLLGSGLLGLVALKRRRSS
jgi:hypothetical protein